MKKLLLSATLAAQGVDLQFATVAGVLLADGDRLAKDGNDLRMR